MKVSSLIIKPAIAAAAAILFVIGCRKPDAAGGGGVPPVQVVAVEAVRQAVSEKLALIGTLAANEMVEIKSETDGTVAQVHFDEGQHVGVGTLLIQLDERKLAAALAEAEANFMLSKSTLERNKQLFADNLISSQEYDQAASTFALHEANVELRRQQLRDTKIFAPFEGTVGTREVSPGQVITKNTTLTWLVDVDPLKVEFDVPERFLSQLQVGQPIEVTLAAFPGRIFQGEVFFVSPYVDPDTRTTLVKARIPNPKSELKPGMFANLELTVQVRGDAVVVPEASLNQVFNEDEATVFVVKPDQTVQAVRVKLGLRLPGKVEIRSGLEGGETVVVEGVQKIGPGSKVTLAPPEDARIYLEGT